ncbi:MAG TPA: ribosome-associated translation inhibitor RaiA [Cyclobacteriaceae bacterium]|nr:ribosome-associated translation inhibitor RaiA [Cyclobacteriaceae bacterium]
MQIIIKSVHFTAGTDLESYATEKMERLTKFNDQIIRAHVTLSLEPGSSPEKRSCEVLLSIPGEDPYLKKTAATFEEAINQAADALEKVLRRMKPR